ncbi:hypothetical protein FRB93_012702 [Tulasnella sp. JGI-2019a]|nr:hypothetical protein FRB93_012702 [Tulasnella sp. JGI-2019a]
MGRLLRRTGSPTSTSTSTSSNPTPSLKPGGLQSKVVLTAVIGGVLIIACSILFLLFKISRYIRSRQARARRKALLRETHDAGLDLMMERRRKGRNVWDVHEPEGIPVCLDICLPWTFDRSPQAKALLL